MRIRDYFPSGPFSALVASIFLAGGLIAVASAARAPHPSSLAVVAGAENGITAASADWQQQFAGDTVPQEMSDIQNKANAFSAAVQSDNLTQSIGKSLLVQYGALQGQGLSGDANADASAAATALAAVAGNAATSGASYARGDLAVAADSGGAVHDYGNALASTIAANGNANETIALLLFGTAVDTQNASSLSQLAGTAADYRALAAAIVKVPVPALFAAYDLQLANNDLQMAAAISDMEQVLTDPMRGLLGLQNFTSLATNNAEVFVQIDSMLKTGGIVFASGEPGAAWDAFAAEAASSSAAEQAALTNATQTGTAADSSDTSDPSGLSSLLNLLQSQ